METIGVYDIDQATVDTRFDEIVSDLEPAFSIDPALSGDAFMDYMGELNKFASLNADALEGQEERVAEAVAKANLSVETLAFDSLGLALQMQHFERTVQMQDDIQRTILDEQEAKKTKKRSQFGLAA